MATTGLITYGANTHNGLTRQYNEDRISIVLDLKSHKQAGKKIVYFAIFDGHGGQGCAEFLRDNLHMHIAQSNVFPSDLTQAIRDGCESAEREFMQQNQTEIRDKSGSCAVICLLTESLAYLGHVGDSRAIMSSDNGRNVEALTIDHKPSCRNE